MKSLLKAAGIALACFVGFTIVLGVLISSGTPKSSISVTPDPRPTITDEEVNELGKRYYDSHIKMKWADDQFYGGKLTQDSANKLMRQCFITFEDQERCESIINEKFWIGMTTDWATMSLGNPNDINRTVTNNLTHEQWIYGDPIYGATYLYFDSGVLTSFQN